MLGSKKVFCIGANKTGTSSLKAALESLGYKVGGQRKAERLLKHWARREWLPILYYCLWADAFQDVPFSLPFTYQVLDLAFPRARFVLSVRDDPEEWFESLVAQHTKVAKLGHRPSPEEMKQCMYVYPGWMWDVHRFAFNADEQNVFERDRYIQAYLAHNATVLEYFKHRPGKLLVLNLSEPRAMERLMTFLGLPYDGRSMPHVNKRS